MTSINLANTTHSFRKKNLYTQSDRNGHYDLYECEYCGLKGKLRTLGYVTVTQDRTCKKPMHPNFNADEIKIISCGAYGPQFLNIKPGSTHKVVTPPEPYKNDETGLWVMGIGEPVKVLNEEFKIIKTTIK